MANLKLSEIRQAKTQLMLRQAYRDLSAGKGAASRDHISRAATYREICSRQHISRFCELYRSFEKTLSVTMRQTHAAGERSRSKTRNLPGKRDEGVAEALI